MREILFKAKRRGDGQWIEGVPVDVTPLSCFEKAPPEILMARAGFADWGMPRPIDYVRVNPDTVCQYTGLMDSSGVKIFEGDIVENRHGVRGVIRYGDWNCGCCYDVYGYVANELVSWDDDSIRVVGNIHDAEESDAED